MSSKISWTDETINPVVGCSHAGGPGCDHCYAENMARRLAAMGLEQYRSVTDTLSDTGLGKYKGWNGDTAFIPSELEKPRKWKTPRTIFVSSMGDLFHESVSVGWQISVLDMVRECKQHTFIFLTKRPVYMKALIVSYTENHVVLPNLVLGVSVEDQATANARIPVLLKTPAAKRFISLEPMIEKVDLNSNFGGTLWIGGQRGCGGTHKHGGPIGHNHGAGTEMVYCNPTEEHHHHDDRCRKGLDGVILGGESGPNARPLHPEWVRLVRDQCAAAGVPFFFKQWGEWAPYDGSTPNTCDYAEQTKYRTMEWENDQWNDVGYPLWCDFEDSIDSDQCTGRVGRKAAGNTLDGRTHTDLPWSVNK